jgi:membrane protein YqaA with SNARE-associated domain
MTFVEEYGYLGLFLFCLLAATIIPISSESALIGAILSDLDIPAVLFWATLGNCLGTLINYFLGIFIGNKWLIKNARLNTKAIRISKKYGWPALFLTWLPVIGDPITIIAGILRWNAVMFVSIVFSLRFLRYYLIVVILF